MYYKSMKRMPFQRPTEHYDERVAPIDEQICKLLQQRKELSDNHPGYPPFEYIDKWAAEFGFYAEYLKTFFGVLENEQVFKPMVEPTVFRTYIPVQKSLQQDGLYYTVTSVRQYSNASIVTFNIEWDIYNELDNAASRKHFELDVGEPYNCRMDTGGSTSGQSSCNYIVSPSLPDDLRGIVFTFREHVRPFNNEPTGKEISIRVD